MQIFEFATEAILDLFLGGKSSAILSTDFRLVLKSNYSFSACLAQIIPHQNQCGALGLVNDFNRVYKEQFVPVCCKPKTIDISLPEQLREYKSATTVKETLSSKKDRLQRQLTHCQPRFFQRL